MFSRSARRLAVLALVLASLLSTAGVRSGNVTRSSSRTVVWIVTDLHFGSVFGCGTKGTSRLRKMIYVSNSRNVDAWIVGGDFAWDDMYPDRQDTLLWLLKDTLRAEIMPVLGNHEATYADTGSGILYNNFTDRWPAYFSPFVSAGRRGSRWWSRRVGNGNVVVIAMNNVRDVSSGSSINYDFNNPNNGDGIYQYDFDGISDSTSAQRQSLRTTVEKDLEPGDWLVVAEHRATHGLAWSGTWPGSRKNQEDVHGNANLSQITWLDQHYPYHYIVVEGDRHESKALLHGRHYVLSASIPSRFIERIDAASEGPLVFWWALGDSIYSPSGSLDDSLGVRGQLKTPSCEWGVGQEIEFRGNEAIARVLLFQYKPNATTQVDSVRMWR